MFKNSAFKIVSGKFASAPLLSTSTILPSSILLIGGIVMWRFWKRQGQLHAQTAELSDDLDKLKKQVAKVKVDCENNKKPAINIPSSFKKPNVNIPSSIKKLFNR
ncbi:MAG: hypothetical protein DSZ21_00215 [Tenericutes bacterium]|nr:MAG: hypothetical protein DSZ21_00215 [Mycoplasmatota bacterium]